MIYEDVYVVAQVRVLQSTCNAARGGLHFFAGVKILPYKTDEFLEIFNCIWPAIKNLVAVSLSLDALCAMRYHWCLTCLMKSFTSYSSLS